MPKDTNSPHTYMYIEPPDLEALVDFAGPHPVSLRVRLDGDQLHVLVISATQAATHLIDTIVTVPEADRDECASDEVDFELQSDQLLDDEGWFNKHSD